jgi:hypothetical protein
MVSKGYKFGKTYDLQSKNSSHLDKTKLKCTNCGKGRHTKDQCFEIVGYPKWWKGDKKKRYEDKGKGAAAATSSVGGPVASRYPSEPKHNGQQEGSQEQILDMKATGHTKVVGPNFVQGTGVATDGVYIA